MTPRTAIFFATLLILASIAESKPQVVPPNDPRIAYDGVLFPQVTPERATFHRFDEATLHSPDSHFDARRAMPATGAVIRFTTASPKIELLLEAQPGENRGSHIGVYRNSSLIEERWFDSKQHSLSFEIVSKKADTATYEVVLPSWASLAFLGMKLQDGTSLAPNPPSQRPVYVAIGDSITHGTGQGSASYKTYPFMLARERNWQLVNLAVGGAKTSPAIGSMLKGKQVDIITILYGFNDWNGHGNPNLYRKDYDALLERLRDGHPSVPIYCITPTLTTQQKSRSGTPASIEAFREVVRNLADTRNRNGDANLFVIEGPTLMTEADLRDKVHLNEKGAQTVAQSLDRVFRERPIGRSTGEAALGR